MAQRGCPITRRRTLITNQMGVPFVVRYLTTNGKSNSCRAPSPFALRYRRVNGDRIRVVGQPQNGFFHRRNPMLPQRFFTEGFHRHSASFARCCALQEGFSFENRGIQGGRIRPEKAGGWTSVTSSFPELRVLFAHEMRSVLNSTKGR